MILRRRESQMCPLQARRLQRGSGVMAVLLIVALLGAAGLLAQGDLAAMARTRAQARSIQALAQARAALIGYAVSYAESHPGEAYGYLPCPDASNTGSTPLGACGARDVGSLGRLPYRTLGLADLRDGWGQCLWYAVAGSVKHNPKPLALNWDSPGQLRPLTQEGTPLSDDERVVATIFAPGPPLPRQARPASSGRRCPGSDNAAADAPQFLDTTYATSFAGKLDVIQGTAASTSSNDLIAWITVDDLFGALRRRADFTPYLGAVIATAASALATRLGDTGFIADRTTLVGALRVGPLPLAAELGLAADRRDAHDNWRDHFRFAACADGSACIVVARSDAAGTAVCRAALLFGGERIRSGSQRQQRLSAAERANAAQYFEHGNADNLLAGVPAFTGAHDFVPSPAAIATRDIVRCLN